MKKFFSFYALIFSQIILNAQTVNVTNATELQNALTAATPGQTIVLAPGTYIKSGGFSVAAGINGTLNNPITIQGNGATISSNNTATGYGLWLKGNNYWVLDNFRVYNSKKAIVIDNSHHNVIKNIVVRYIGDEGIHLRTYSSYNTVDNCNVDSLGIVSGASGIAEGIYVGSAKSNWDTYTGGNPDTCNYNTLTNNSFGDNVPSENMDIKEGTRYGTISNNTFNGTGLNGANSADSWIDMKGDYWTIECNTGSVVKGSASASGYQTHENTVNSIVYGHDNIFSNNVANVDAGQYGFYLHKSGMSIICSNNTVTGGLLFSGTLTNCSGSASCLTTGVNINESRSGISLYPNPAKDFINLTISSNSNYSISDILGKIIQTGTLIKGNSTIDISEFNNGLYLINFKETNTSLKFIKQ